MSDQISWHVQLAVKPGQLDNFRALTIEMVGSTRQVAGVLNYERFVSADGNFVHVYERYTEFRHGSRTLTKIHEELQRPIHDDG
jgi:quinol monooxygenase YgiN